MGRAGWVVGRDGAGMCACARARVHDVPRRSIVTPRLGMGWCGSESVKVLDQT